MFRTRIYTGIAIIVAFGVLAMFLIYRNLGTVAGYLSTLDHVSVPFSIAALEMEKNAGEYATGVLRYVADPDPALRAEAQHDVSDFQERHAIYLRLSTNERERSLGKRVKAEHDRLVGLGNAMMDERDRLDAAFQQTTDMLEQIDRLLDGPLSAAVAAGEPARAAVLTAMQNVEAETAEIGYWLTLFRHRPTPAARRNLLAKVREQHDAVAQLRRLPLNSDADRLRLRVLELHRQISDHVMTVLEGESELARRAQRLDLLAERIDDIFDNEIQVMLIEDLVEPRQQMDAAIERLQLTLRYVIPAYLLAALVIGLLLIRTIIRPIQRLAAGTDAIGGGDLDYRIPAHGDDEFGQLARQFNAMAQRLQDSTVSRALLEKSEHQLQQTVAELRQEILERQQAERERERLQAQLQRSRTLAAMGQLVAGVAHEVRNPLFGISSTLDAMQASAESGRTNPRYQEVLRREVDRLNRLMAELLEYGRMPPADRTTESLGKVLSDAIRSCQTVASAAGVALDDRMADDALVTINRDRILQVAVNLIENALQHAPRDSVVIVGTRVGRGGNDGDADARWIEFCVLDDGPGFAAEDLPQIFDPFFTRRRRGTGLGLAIARRIVDEHHGSIAADNRTEGGAIMTVRLPVAGDRAAMAA